MSDGMLTQSRLKELLNYEPKTGIFKWKVHRPNISPKKLAGWIGKGGYKYISVDYKHYMAHRLAWLYVYGYFPENGLDHINRIRDDNRIENLREASKVCNARNCNISKRNTTGITGVSWHKLRCKYRSHIRIPGKSIHLGLYKTKIEAAKARWDAEVEHDFPNCNTTSSAYQYLKKHGAI